MSILFFPFIFINICFIIYNTVTEKVFYISIIQFLLIFTIPILFLLKLTLPLLVFLLISLGFVVMMNAKIKNRLLLNKVIQIALCSVFLFVIIWLLPPTSKTYYNNIFEKEKDELKFIEDTINILTLDGKQYFGNFEEYKLNVGTKLDNYLQKNRNIISLEIKSKLNENETIYQYKSSKYGILEHFKREWTEIIPGYNESGNIEIYTIYMYAYPFQRLITTLLGVLYLICIIVYIKLLGDVLQSYIRYIKAKDRGHYIIQQLVNQQFKSEKDKLELQEYLTNSYDELKESNDWNIALSKTLNNFGDLKHVATILKSNKYFIGNSIFLGLIIVIMMYFLLGYSDNQGNDFVFGLIVITIITAWFIANITRNIILKIRHWNLDS